MKSYWGSWFDYNHGFEGGSSGGDDLGGCLGVVLFLGCVAGYFAYCARESPSDYQIPVTEPAIVSEEIKPEITDRKKLDRDITSCIDELKLD